MTAIVAVAGPGTAPAFPPPAGPAVPEQDGHSVQAGADPARLLSFPAGLPGFPGCRHFQLERVPGSSLLLLQSLDDAGPSFFVLPLPGGDSLIRPMDRLAACRSVGLPPCDTDFLAIVTARRSHAALELFANLRAPVVIDTRRRIGAQIVLADAAYPLRHPVVAAA
ncbi:flagellar assembly protein FliW [Geminicoccus flavidas]|uniref:flagellar assembly protein FliW n=1 Tax=Geminicoccus flavidas TaxID=2506407 RepID=UPI0013587F90|nr:flagellar assembly protein FliW [Geminicoccus flavidas]